MSGHSKWANMHRKKEKSDAKRGKEFTKIGRELAVAVKMGGSNPDANTKLKDVIAKAKAANMSNESIQRSIKKAAGEDNSLVYEEILYEGYGPNGVAFMVEGMTDNRNRTAAEMRHIFDKGGGQLGQSGSVAWMFERKGILLVEQNDSVNEEDLMMAALDAGASDVLLDDGLFEVQTGPNEYSAVRDALESGGYAFLSAQVQWVPTTTVEADEELTGRLEWMIDKFEDNDDVQNVYHNAELAEEL